MPKDKEPKKVTKIAPPSAVPEGYKKRSTELVGFWDMEKGPIHFVPKFARVFDSDIDNKKPSILIIGDAVGGVAIQDKDGKETAATDNQPIGVWYKPGMAAIKDLMGVKVFMYMSGEQDTGKPNPMKTFDVLSRQDGQTLFITEDFRKVSLHVALPLPVKGKETSSARAEDDDENFGEKKDIPL